MLVVGMIGIHNLYTEIKAGQKYQLVLSVRSYR